MGNLTPDASLQAAPRRPRRGNRTVMIRQAGSPYARLQLFRNPFGELTRAERADLAIVDVEECLGWLQDDRAVLQIIGPCGHGKTTHLLAIERRMIERRMIESWMAESAYIYCPEDGQQPTLPSARPLLVDEAQRLGWRRRGELLRGGGPLVVSTHVDLSRKLVRAGFRLRTLDLAEPVDAERLQSLLNRRIAASALIAESASSAAAESHYLQLAEVVALQRQFGSNIRLIEHHLYEVFQRFAEKGEPWRPAS